MDDKETQQQKLVDDQERLKRVYADIYQKKHKAISEEVGHLLAKTPEYKHERKKSLLTGGGAGALAGGAATRLLRKSPKAAVAAGLGSVALGATGGELTARHKLKRVAGAKTQQGLMKSLKREADKNVAIHSYLAQPGVQRLTVKRPWGEERYEG